MLMTRTNVPRRYLALLLSPALSLAAPGCDTGDAPLSPLAEAPLDDAGDALRDLSDAAAMNAAIQDGTRAFAQEHGIEALWQLVEPARVGNIQSVSDDGARVLFLSATEATDGRMVPNGELWLADLEASTLVSLGRELGVPLHGGVLSADGAHVAAVGGEEGDLFVNQGADTGLALAVENDGAASFSGLTWNRAGDKLGFAISPNVHLEDLLGQVPEDELPSSRIAWVAPGAEARLVDDLDVVTDGLVHMSGLRWSGDQLELAEPEVEAAGKEDALNKGYCALGTMKRAGNYVGLKLPWQSGTSYLVGDDCNHVNRGDKRDFDIDGGSLHNGGAVLSVAAGTVIALKTTVADPDEWTCNNSHISYDANYVIVQHFGASNTAFTSLYWHLRRSPAVQVSYQQQIGQGQILGYNGCTGFAYGEHLHFGMREGTSTSYNATEAVPEPIDGYSNLDAGNWYNSSNSGSSTPPPSSGGNLLVREGTNYALNGYSPYSGRELTVWAKNTSDPEQRWDLLAPGTYGSNAGWMIRRRGTSYCVNAPSIYDYAPVNLWACSGSDPDQQFDRLDYGSSKLYRRRGTNHCLNGHELTNYGQVTLWTCNTGDIEQRWVIQ